MTNDQYAQVHELEILTGANQYLQEQFSTYELAIDASSRWIDARCSAPERNIIRHFYQEDSPSTRDYHANDRRWVRVGDFMDPTALAVEVDLVGDGTFTALNPGDWYPEPINRPPGEPYNTIVIATYDTAFPLWLRPGVRATTPWGYVTCPSPVKQACEILSVAFMLGKTVIADENGYGIGSTSPTDPFALAENLLRRYLPPGDDDDLMPRKR